MYGRRNEGPISAYNERVRAKTLFIFWSVGLMSRVVRFPSKISSLNMTQRTCSMPSANTVSIALFGSWVMGHGSRVRGQGSGIGGSS